MVNWVLAPYRRLPIEVRKRIRSLLPKRLLRWYAHRKTDVYLISYPKCGRTWLRLMIGRAISCHFKLPEDEELLLLNWRKKPHPSLPQINAIHDDRPMLKAPEDLEGSKEKYRNKRVIFLARDPRDVIISSYFETKKRGALFGENPYEARRGYFEGSLPEFIRRREGGFDTLLAYYNIWAQNRYVPRGFLLVRYEDLRSNPHKELRRLFDFLELHSISDEIIAEAIEFASFDRMRKMEAEGKFQTNVLKPGDRLDQDSYKTRKGKIGGFADYLSSGEIDELNQKMRLKLSDYFGYCP